MKRLLTIATVLYTLCTALSAAGQATASPLGAKLTQPFVIADAYGHKTDITQQTNKVVFINFWSLTCAPCKAEMPTINNLEIRYTHDTNFRVLPIDLDRNFTADIAYFNKKNLSLPVYAPAGVVPQSLFMGELPTTVVIDKHGKIVFFMQGADTYDSPQFYHLIDSLLAQ